ncbi:hypothetical protein N802_09180 [Knoellia sinensis KCTC 19936]|uniref:Uncharacterized protein n=1 Tax=Knoellia sinensis KCTC 19936 TaxID=1385520 RepID=A0A0A0J0S2_9MICO|nr:hypothetical protein [Knoellia sinensis]KGN30319.1 hypothetical protein N802_09180 [Knoellia sinensis KCTC 19936]
MNGGAGVALVAVSVFAWAMYADWKYATNDRLARWLLPIVRRWGRRYGLAAFLLSLAGLALFGVAEVAGYFIARAMGDPRWSLLAVLPAMLAYAPVTFAMAPIDTLGFQQWRESLRKAGAGDSEQRWIARLGGLPALLGLSVMISALFPIFL